MGPITALDVVFQLAYNLVIANRATTSGVHNLVFSPIAAFKPCTVLGYKPHYRFIVRRWLTQLDTSRPRTFHPFANEIAVVYAPFFSVVHPRMAYAAQNGYV